MRVAIPQSYEDITVKEWQTLEKEWSRPGSDEQKTSRTVKVLLGLTDEQLRSIHVKEWPRITAAFNWLLSSETHAHELVPRFYLHGKEYGFVPDWSKLTTGEFIDLEAYASAGFTDNLAEVLSVMYRPVIDSQKEFYEIEAYDPSDRKVEVMRDAPMSVALGSMVFFLTTVRELAIDTRRYLREAEKQEHSKRSGVGMLHFIHWLTGMFSKSRKSLK
jgi:hypothetical protein